MHSPTRPHTVLLDSSDSLNYTPSTGLEMLWSYCWIVIPLLCIVFLLLHCYYCSIHFLSPPYLQQLLHTKLSKGRERRGVCVWRVCVCVWAVGNLSLNRLSWDFFFFFFFFLLMCWGCLRSFFPFFLSRANKTLWDLVRYVIWCYANKFDLTFNALSVILLHFFFKLSTSIPIYKATLMIWNDAADLRWPCPLWAKIRDASSKPLERIKKV